MKEFLTAEVVINWLMYLAGMTIYILVVKIPSYKERGIAMNKPFKLIDWLRADGSMMVVNILFAFMCTLAWNQLSHFHPGVADYNRLVFGLIGLAGNTIIFKYISTYSKIQLDITNVKSNTADVMTGNKSTDKSQIVETMNRVTGKDIAKEDPLNQKPQ